jgi:hypothetical protein
MADEEDKKKKPKAKAKPKKKPKKKDSKDLTDKQKAAGFGGKGLQGVARLAVQVKEINLKAEGKKTDKERLDKLDELIKATKFGDKESRQTLESLKSEFLASQERLRLARETGDEKLIAIEEENQERVASASSDVEKTREAEKATKKQSKLLEGIKSGIGSLANKFKDNAGFLAGLAGVALAVFNPEALQKLIDRTVGAIVDAFDVVTKIFQGDFKGALDTFTANMGDISLLIGGLALLNYGKLVAAVTAIKNGFIAIQGGMAAAGIGLGPAVLIGAAIAVTIAGLVETFKKVKSTFEETGSIFEAFKAGIIEFPSQLLGIPLNLIKDAISWVMSKFGFDTTAMDSFSFTDEFRKIYTFMFDGISNAISYIGDLFSSAFEEVPKIFSKIKDKLTGVFEAVSNKLAGLKTLIKAVAGGAWAAIKAAAPGGESPGEAYQRVYNEIMSSGNSSDKSDSISMDSGTSGDTLNNESIENRMNNRKDNRSQQPVVVNNVDNSTQSNSNTSVVSGRSGRKRGFGSNNESAYA